MNKGFWILLALHLAWCAVVFCQGVLFGLWLEARAKAEIGKAESRNPEIGDRKSETGVTKDNHNNQQH